MLYERVLVGDLFLADFYGRWVGTVFFISTKMLHANSSSSVLYLWL